MDNEKKEKRVLKKWHLAFFLIIALSFVVLRIWQIRWPDTYVELKGQKLHVLLADNYYHWYKGLGGRDSLNGFDGMLFLFSFPSQQGIVMRDMKFPLDIVWLNNGIVVDLVQNVPLEPNTAEKDLHVYYPRDVANLVLELPAGWSEKQGLKIGDNLALIKLDKK